MKRSISFFLLMAVGAAVAVSIHSCKLQSIDPENVDLGYDYYPLEIGRYIIYNAYDTVYNTEDVMDTMYHVKEVVNSSFMEGTEEKFEVYHYTKKITDSDWPIQPDSVWTIVRNANQLLRTESNIEYIKLVFPVKEGKTWNGNAKNTLGHSSSGKLYHMTDVDKPYTINNVVYPETLKMVIANQDMDTVVSRDVRYDIYAKGIGFVKKDYTTYYFKQGTSGPSQIDYGSHKIMEVTSYGKE